MPRISQIGLPHSLREFYRELTSAPNLVSESDVLTSGASPIAADLTVYQTVITTGGTMGAEDVTVGDGTGAIVGQRKLITLGTRTHASDVVNLDHANIVSASGGTLSNLDMDAADEEVLLEWNGAKWQIVSASAGVVDESEALTSGAAPVGLDLTMLHTVITTGGTDASEDVTLGDGTGITVGHRKLITLGTRTSGSDVVNLDHANMANAAGTDATNVDMDAAAEFVFVEWNGTKWQIIYANATITP